MSAREEPERDTIYPFREDSALLLPFATLRSGRLLEVMCGEGRAALAAVRAGARVVATDLNPHALRDLACRARNEGLSLGIVRTDLFHGLGRFDRILANPPYLPSVEGAPDPEPWVDRALNGGMDGLRVTDRLVREFPAHLRTGGAMYLLSSTLQSAAGWETMLERLRSTGGMARRVDSRLLEGERLEVWELRGDSPDQPTVDA